MAPQLGGALPQLPNVKLMVEALTSDDTVKSQNAAGVLAYLAMSSKDCLKAISRVDGIAEALAWLIASENVDLQHNAALLLGQLSTDVEFRRVLGKQPNALSVLVQRLMSPDADIQCNVAWALRQLVLDGVHRDAMIKLRTSSSLRPLLSSDDERVKTNALALIEVLRRPPRIQTDSPVLEGRALVGLASLSSAGSASDSCRSSDNSPHGAARKAKLTPTSQSLKRPAPLGSVNSANQLGSAAKQTKLDSLSTSKPTAISMMREESPKVDTAEDGINALLSATQSV
jgi:hypothetical protein